MSRTVPYERQTLDSPNPLARFAQRRRHTTALRLVSQAAGAGASALDFGCGTGVFLNQLHALRPDLTLYGFDPGKRPAAPAYTPIARMDAIPDEALDVVSCLETLEHLFPDELDSFCREVNRTLRDGGMLIVSVPIIGGPALLLKELNQVVVNRRPAHYTPGELFRAALLGIPAPRPADVRHTHKGFDYRVIQALLASAFTLSERFYSPFRFLPWPLNSQVFFVCEKHRAGAVPAR